MEEKRRSKGCVGWFLVAVVLALVIGAVVITVKKRSENHDDGGDVGPPGAVQKKYADALSVAMQFFDVQKSGKLEGNEIVWRGNSALEDGSPANLDLSKGMYDAGDHMKFGFPMAFTASVLSWAILEYGDQMGVVNELDAAKGSLKWITDYLVEAHPSPDVLYIQVGDPDIDHACWDRPEMMKEKRPLIQVNASVPGTEVGAETAAALASASLVFKSSDPTYSSTLLEHAKQLFTFANKHRASYSESIPEVQTYYNSTGYGDELLWAAGWLYHATGDRTYLDFVVQNGDDFAKFGSPTWFCWDNKLAGAQVLLSRVSFFGANGLSSSEQNGLKKYKSTAEAVMCSLLPKSPTATTTKTDTSIIPLALLTNIVGFLVMVGGLLWVSEWNSLQHPVASAFLATIYSNYMLTSNAGTISCDGKSFKASDLRKYAQSQADYVLGNNPLKMSYLVGYGDKYPQFVHHRGASIPADATTGCKDGFQYLDSTDPNPNVATGGLVGGPFLNETYIDSRNNSMQGEPTTYNSALIVGLLSGLVTSSSVVRSFK